MRFVEFPLHPQKAPKIIPKIPKTTNKNHTNEIS